MKYASMLAAMMSIWAYPSSAATPDCHIRIVREVTDDLGNTWRRGKILPVDIQRDDARGVSFCAHGGS